MTTPESSAAEEVWGGLYAIVADVRAPTDTRRVLLGSKGVCRFCGRQGEEVSFRHRAHTIPEALGNKWIFSRDECDDCNERFTRYDDALADAVSPLLTLGGVRGKKGVRQTGRSQGDAVVRHTMADGKRRISVRHSGDAVHGLPMAIRPGTRELEIALGVPGVPFRPQWAFKALTKIALAVLPAERLSDFSRLRSWLLEDGHLRPRSLEVGLSFTSVGNAPPFASCTVLEKQVQSLPTPDVLFVLTVGSVCAQLELLSDAEWDVDLPRGTLNIKWTNVVRDAQGTECGRFAFGDPVRFDWSSMDSRPQPIAAFRFRFDPETRQGTFVPVLRS